jgi:hypothetical protein
MQEVLQALTFSAGVSRYKAAQSPAALRKVYNREDHAMTELEVRDLNPLFGAEIIGFEPKMPLDDATLLKLRALFDDKGMLVFRDLDTDREFQNYLSYALIGKEPPARSHRESEARFGRVQ